MQNHTIRSHFATTAAALLLAFPVVANAQNAVTQIPRGDHIYDVYPDQESGMEAWFAKIEVRDDTLNGGKATSVTYRTRALDDGYRFNSFATWKPDDAKTLRATWVSAGRSAGTCKVTVADGKISASAESGKGDYPVKTAAAPEFAVASMIASRALADGDTVRYDVFRCSTGTDAPALVMTWDFKGVVKSGMMPRAAGGNPEAVWVVTGDSNYPYQLWIAKSDRQVLKAIVPQGTVGSMTEVLRPAGK